MTATREIEFRSVKIGDTFYRIIDGTPVECVRSGPRTCTSLLSKGGPEWFVGLKEKVRVEKQETGSEEAAT